MTIALARAGRRTALRPGRALRGALLLLGAALLAGCAWRSHYVELYPFKARVAVDLADPDELARNVATVPVFRKQRYLRVARMFHAAGCRNLRRQRVTGSPTPNVICTLPGRTAKRIVVGAHHVVAVGGKGVFDAWTSVAMLPALYEALASAPREHTYEFVAFTSTPLQGDASLEYLRKVSEPENIAAMVWLDLLGLGEPKVRIARSDPNLWADINSVAVSIGVPVERVDFGGAAAFHDHSRAFRWERIPTIFVHSLDQKAQRLLSESGRDMDPDQIDLDAYYRTYKVLAVFLAYLDETLPARRELAGS